ncbi:uncharacterized protein LOC123498700 [Portunus trituberculatus]|uniref:uncharacterized protein LOC123498700 n=1 Tax=Portunus trituberculatus TaxID=210409 RepID=UPI001E1D0C3C|nr:uncharacterized protein LOC123498700 [Portunus trituberculatus]
MQLALLVCLAAAATAAPQFGRFWRPYYDGKHIAILSQSQEGPDGPRFRYAFQTENGINVQARGTPGSKGQSNIDGSFSFPSLREAPAVSPTWLTKMATAQSPRSSPRLTRSPPTPSSRSASPRASAGLAEAPSHCRSRPRPDAHSDEHRLRTSGYDDHESLIRKCPARIT